MLVSSCLSGLNQHEETCGQDQGDDLLTHYSLGDVAVMVIIYICKVKFSKIMNIQMQG